MTRRFSYFLYRDTLILNTTRTNKWTRTLLLPYETWPWSIPPWQKLLYHLKTKQDSTHSQLQPIHTSTSSNSLNELIIPQLNKPYTLTRRRRSYSDSHDAAKQASSPAVPFYSPPLSTRSQRARQRTLRTAIFNSRRSFAQNHMGRADSVTFHIVHLHYSYIDSRSTISCRRLLDSSHGCLVSRGYSPQFHDGIQDGSRKTVNSREICMGTLFDNVVCRRCTFARSLGIPLYQTHY